MLSADVERIASLTYPLDVKILEEGRVRWNVYRVGRLAKWRVQKGRNRLSSRSYAGGPSRSQTNALLSNLVGQSIPRHERP